MFRRSKSITFSFLTFLLLTGTWLVTAVKGNARHAAPVLHGAVADTTAPDPDSALRASVAAVNVAMLHQDTATSTITDTVAVAPDADVTVPASADESDNYTREEKLRRYPHALYDSTQPAEDAKEALDYPSMWTRQLPANAARDLRRQKEFNYEKKTKPPSNWNINIPGLGRVLQVLIYLILFGALAFAVYYILQSNGISVFARRSKNMLVTSEGKTLDDISSDDYPALLAQTMAAANWTASVRFLYLFTLQQLQAKGLIHMGPDKTNRDYLRDLTNTRWYKNFAVLTLDYEYVCYGNFDISRQDFETIYQQFNTFKNDLGQS